jgi:mRNA-degrading endonuclease toxin of MazEF toxin-antitoxin module
MINRGDVVIARFPYAGGGGYKVRPAVVIQCDRLNRQLHDTRLALVTGNTRLVGREPTQFLIDPATPEGASAGIAHASAAKCENIATVPQADVLQVVGHLSDVLKQKLNDCLKTALDLT